MKTKSELCLECLECCKFVRIPVLHMTDDLGEFFKARGISLSHESGMLFAIIRHICPWLTPKGCKIYEDRPNICREYDGRDDPVVDCKWVV